MADLGDLLGSLMSGLIRARRMADEQTAALAEYYRENPLLEGLSVPRIRIPELTIEMPFLIESSTEGESGEMADSTKIVDTALLHIKEALAKEKIKTSSAFYKTFATETKSMLDQAKQTGTPVMKEAVARIVQDAFITTLSKSKTVLNAQSRESIATGLHSKISAVSLGKRPVPPGIVANIKTADVKERSTSTSVVRLKITLKEEGLEWATQASDSGGVIKTLQPE